MIRDNLRSFVILENVENDLAVFLRKKAEEHWNDRQLPYFLSLVSPDFKKLGTDYKVILRDETLKTFVKRTSAHAGYRLVEHPRQRAKLGVVPNNIDFKFENEIDKPTENATRTEFAPALDEKEALLNFLGVISKLPKDDLDKIVIPTSILVKLLGGR